MNLKRCYLIHFCTHCKDRGEVTKMTRTKITRPRKLLLYQEVEGLLSSKSDSSFLYLFKYHGSNYNLPCSKLNATFFQSPSFFACQCFLEVSLEKVTYATMRAGL